MKSLLLFPVFMMPTVLTISIGETRREVRSEWNIDYKWTDITFSAWVPHGGTSKEIIIIETHFKDFIYPVTCDKITLYTDRIQINQMRKGKCTSVLNESIDPINYGWADFVLTVDSHYDLKYLEKTILATNISVDYMPMSLVIKGSNITLDCPAKLRTWEIAERSVSIPLDGSTEHSLRFFSTSEFLPSIALEEREFKLGWNNGTLTTIPSISQPLPPFVQHHLRLKCWNDERTTCTMMVGEKMMEAEKMFLADIPQSISVKGNPGDDFFVFLYQDDPVSNPNEVEPNFHQTSERSPVISADSSCDFYVAFLMTLIICIFLCIILVGRCCYIYWNHRKTQEKKIEEEKSIGQRKSPTSIEFLLGKQCSADSGLEEEGTVSDISEREYSSLQTEETNSDSGSN